MNGNPPQTPPGQIYHVSMVVPRAPPRPRPPPRNLGGPPPRQPNFDDADRNTGLHLTPEPHLGVGGRGQLEPRCLFESP